MRINKRMEVPVMQYTGWIVGLCAVLASSMWSGSAASQEASSRAAIEAVNQQFMEIFRSADPAALTALYTSNGQLLPPHGDIVTGTQAINQFWQGFLAPGIAVTFKSLEVETHGDTGHEVAYYTVTGEGGKVLDTGKYIVIWKREGGQWKLHRDIWNTNTSRLLLSDWRRKPGNATRRVCTPIRVAGASPHGIARWARGVSNRPATTGSVTPRALICTPGALMTPNARAQRADNSGAQRRCWTLRCSAGLGSRLLRRLS